MRNNGEIMFFFYFARYCSNASKMRWTVLLEFVSNLTICTTVKEFHFINRLEFDRVFLTHSVDIKRVDINTKYLHDE